MTKKTLIFSIAFASLLQAGAENGVRNPLIAAAMKEMQSAQESDRIAGFYSVINAGLGPYRKSEFPVPDAVLAIAKTDTDSRVEIVRSLNALLDLEITSIKTAGLASSDSSDYLGDVIQAVTTLRDTSSIPVLLKCVSTGGMVAHALASLGDESLNATLVTLPTAADEDRRSLFRMLGEMAETRNISRLASPESRLKLREAIINGARDEDPFVRIAAVPGLLSLRVPEAAELLKELSTSDPFTLNDATAVRYPVREAAARALKTAGSKPR
jgi:hypothetical protein